MNPADRPDFMRDFLGPHDMELIQKFIDALREDAEHTRLQWNKRPEHVVTMPHMPEIRMLGRTEAQVKLAVFILNNTIPVAQLLERIVHLRGHESVGLQEVMTELRKVTIALREERQMLLRAQGLI